MNKANTRITPDQIATAISLLLNNLVLLFDYIRGFKSSIQHGLYETFRSSLSAIQTLIMD